MFCKNCGKEINNNADFCSECGCRADKNIESVPPYNNQFDLCNQQMYYGMYDNRFIQENKVSGLSIASLILGTLSLISACLISISTIMGFLAIIFGISGISSGKSGKGMAISGIVTGIIGLFFSFAFAQIFFT